MKLFKIFMLSVVSLVLLQTTASALECNVKVTAMSPNGIMGKNISGYDCDTLKNGETGQFFFDQTKRDVLMVIVLSAISMERNVYIHSVKGDDGQEEMDDVAIIVD